VRLREPPTLKLHEHRFPVETHTGEAVGPDPKPFQLPSAHGPLFVHARAALREDINVLLLRQQLHLHPFTNCVPGQSERRLFQLRQLARLIGREPVMEMTR
jgi:hypothetical protein